MRRVDQLHAITDVTLQSASLTADTTYSTADTTDRSIWPWTKT